LFTPPISNTRTTGLITGTYADLAKKVSAKFNGILLQKQNRINGSYIAGGRSGLFTISPR
jgi:hypothetical protein